MEYRQYRIKDVAELINGRAYLMPELQQTGKYRILRVGNFSNKDEWYYSDMELDDDKYCYSDDLLYKWSCSFGPEIWKGEKTIYHYHIWKMKVNEDVVDKMFLYYYLKFYTPFLLGGTNGTTMVHITKDSMEKKKIVIPALKTIQKKIAGILLNYDRFIENNNRKISLLEKIVEETYKEWFIRFKFPENQNYEFVYDKPYGWIYGNKSNMSIPCNWHFGKLAEIGQFVRGKNITSTEMQEGEIPVVSAGIEPSGYHNEANVKGKSLTMSASGANAGYLKYNLNDIWAADCSYYQNDENIWFVYSSLKFIESAIRNLQVGSAQPHVYAKNINKLNIIIPEEKYIKMYNDLVNPMFEEISRLNEKNKILVKQRDLLLPRLMSGKLEVK
jgi:type I restriction enzyme S subunit